MGIEKLIAEAQKGKVAPVLLITGDETLLITRAVDAIRAGTVGTGPRGFNEDHFEASSVNAATVVDAARSLPMMAKVRLVWVRNVDAWKADAWEELLRYAQAPVSSSVLVLTAEKLHGSLKIVSLAKKGNWLYDAAAPDDRDLEPWLDDEARRRKITFAQGAAASLLMAIGADLSALVDGLERLSLFAGDRPITERDIEEVIAPIRESGPFELSEAVADKNVARCFSLIDSASRSREKDRPALVLLALVVRQIRMLALARDAVDRGDDPTRVFAGKMPPFVARKIAGQAKHWTPKQLFRALERCSGADLRLKSGGGRGYEWRVMEQLVLELCAA
jgi:DNA polymerase-3 subunit delta